MAQVRIVPSGMNAPLPADSTPESQIAKYVAPQTFCQLLIAIACLALPLAIFALWAFGTNRLIDKTLIRHLHFVSDIGQLTIWKDATANATDLVGRLVYFGSYRFAC